MDKELVYSKTPALWALEEILGIDTTPDLLKLLLQEIPEGNHKAVCNIYNDCVLAENFTDLKLLIVGALLKHGLKRMDKEQEQ